VEDCGVIAQDPLKRFGLAGRTILVTGASGHLGRPIAEAIAAAGGMPLLAGRSQSKLDAISAEFSVAGQACETLAFDVGDPGACRKAISAHAARGGVLHGVVNGAYGGRASSLEEALDTDFDVAYRQNVTGPFALLQAALPLLRTAAKSLDGGASVVNIGSMYGHVSPDPSIYGDSGMNNPPYYGPAKAGLVQLTRYLAVHLGSDRIRVNSVSPGPFPPPSLKTTAPELHASLCKKTPLGRIGAAEELVGPVLFLLSDAASFITGSDVRVDGGWTAW
jgi:NAD(P)-dependent dehydrogenase (short-subunit alcohol dehydrogenase family)